MEISHCYEVYCECTNITFHTSSGYELCSFMSYAIYVNFSTGSNISNELETLCKLR